MLLAADPIDADVLRLRHESQGEGRREDRPGLRRLPSHSITATLQFDSGYAATRRGAVIFMKMPAANPRAAPITAPMTCPRIRCDVA